MKSLLSHRHAASVAAWVFVFIWATGFVIARGINGLIDPYLFLLLRFICVLLLFATAMLLMRSPWPTIKECLLLAGIGALMQGLYLGPAFWAVSQGLEAGVMSLIGAMQPPVTAVLAWYFLKEKLGKKTILGLLLGMAGVALTVYPKLGISSGQIGYSGWVMAAAIFSIGSITAGTLLQKSSILSVPLLSAITLQTLGATIVMLLMAITLGELSFTRSFTTLAYLGYAVFILSLGGFTLLTWLVRTGSATRTSSLMLVVPPIAAGLSWWLYGENLSALQLSGFALALSGVLLARA